MLLILLRNSAFFQWKYLFCLLDFLICKRFFWKSDFRFGQSNLKIFCRTYVWPDLHRIGLLDRQVKNIYCKAFTYIENQKRYKSFIRFAFLIYPIIYLVFSVLSSNSVFHWIFRNIASCKFRSISNEQQQQQQLLPPLFTTLKIKMFISAHLLSGTNLVPSKWNKYFASLYIIAFRRFMFVT